MSWRDFQRTQRVVELGDRFLSYVDEGRGPPVVLIHGIPTWGYLWADVARQLSTRCRVLVPDLLGFGFSDKRDRFDRSIGAQADALVAWLDRLGVERATIVGHDIGGGVALRLGAFHPERVERLVVLNTVCYDSWPIELMLQLGHPQAYRRLAPRALTTLLRVALGSGFACRPPRAFLEGLLAPWGTDVGALSLVRCAAALNTNLTVELTPLLPRLEPPLLVVWGEDDTFQPVELGQRLAWDVPGARLVRVANARHFVMVDRPDVVVRELGGFLGIERLAA